MARTAFTVQTTAASGIVLAAAAAVDAGNGNEFVNDGRTMIEITNGSGATVTATFVTNGTYNVSSTAYPIADLDVTVAASAAKACGPFDRTLFNSGTGTVQVNWSSGTSITARCVALGTA
jgi:hypothetical protein